MSAGEYFRRTPRQTMSGRDVVASDVVAAHVFAVFGLFACFTGGLSLYFAESFFRGDSD